MDPLNIRWRLRPSSLLIGLWLGVAGTVALAQNIPNAGSLLQETQRQPLVPDSPRPPAPAQLARPAAAENATQAADPMLRFQVSSITVQGATLIAADDVQNTVKAWLNREITIADLRAAAQAITDAYQRRGWYARAQLPAQEIRNGQVHIDVIEGRLGAVRVDDGGVPLRLHTDLLTNTLTARQKPGDPLRLPHIERAAGLLGDTPGVEVKVTLAPGAAKGEADVLVQAKDKPLFAGNVSLDDYGARSTGANRVSANLNLNNPSGGGDQASLSTVLAEGNQYLRLAYALPVGPDGLRVGANVSGLQYHLLNEFALLDARGSANTVGLSAAYPVLRSGARKLMAATALEQREYRNTVSGADISHYGSTVLSASLYGDQFDAVGAGGYTAWAVNLGWGRLDLSRDAAYQAADRAGPATEGDYSKLGWSLARQQHIGNQTSVWLAATGQLASKNLDASEKFALGGANGVRAYPALEATGDAGWLLNLELIRQINTQLQVFAFYDYGTIQLNQSPNGATALANGLNSYDLKGYGIGLGWSKPNHYAVRMALARRDGSNPAANAASGLDNDGSNQLYRFWISASAYF